MSHEMSGFNKHGQQVAYARFSMGNSYARLLYKLLDATDYDAGVSGRGDSTRFTIQQIEKALDNYLQLYANADVSGGDAYDHKQISEFIKTCLTTAKNEGSVKVSFY